MELIDSLANSRWIAVAIRERIMRQECMIGAVAAALSLAGPAFAELLTEKTGVNQMLDVSPSTSDFVNEAAISDMFEIQSSNLPSRREVRRSRSLRSA